MSASPATGAGKAVGQDPALEVLAQVPLDEARIGIQADSASRTRASRLSKWPWTTW